MRIELARARLREDPAGALADATAILSDLGLFAVDNAIAIETATSIFADALRQLERFSDAADAYGTLTTLREHRTRGFTSNDLVVRYRQLSCLNAAYRDLEVIALAPDVIEACAGVTSLDDPRLLSIRLKMIVSRHRVGEYATAIDECNSLLPLLVATNGAEGRQTLRARFWLGSSQIQLGRYEGIQSLRGLQADCRRILGPNDSLTKSLDQLDLSD